MTLQTYKAPSIRHPASGIRHAIGQFAYLLSGIFFLFIFLTISQTVISQAIYPQTLFRSPVDFGIMLSGSYGEIRPNHFHSGIDIRTGGQTGKPVYAAADGYISRIFVSPWGFGKALYINHSSGYTTVYGHLDRFRSEIATYAIEQQYSRESFSIDVTVPSGKMPVRKGDVIGYSGNSGSSGGPHLHFEIRDGGNQEPLDPVSFGIPVKDNLPPQIRWVKIYPLGQTSMVNFTGNPKALQVTGSNGNYSVIPADTVMVTGDIIFGIEAYDYQDGSSVRCGIKSVVLKVDGVTVFGQKIDRYAFADTRYVNAILDYPQTVRNKQRYFRSYVAPGNKLEIFDGVVNRGIVNFTDRKPHKVEYVVEDARGNSSRLSFWVKSHPPPPAGAWPQEQAKPANLFAWDRENNFEDANIEFTIPPKALYEDLDFQYYATAPVNGSYARVHHLQDEETPLHLRCTVSIRAETLPVLLEAKALLVKVEKEGKFVSQGGKFSDGFVTGTIREFGEYTISVDTVSPKIKPVNIYHNKNVVKQRTIVVTITDDFSGIDNYRATLNGRWILMDYDAKQDKLEYTFDDRIKAGSNKFQLVVTDGVGNRAEYNATLIR